MDDVAAVESDFEKLLRKAHSQIMADNSELKKPSPWFGELFDLFRKLWVQQYPLADIPERYAVLSLLLKLDIPFRHSGDYSDDYRTIYHRPTAADVSLMKRMTGRKYVVARQGDERQIVIFQQ
ncbi:MAG: hypothetical protein V1799_07870 [bacterium]